MLAKIQCRTAGRAGLGMGVPSEFSLPSNKPGEEFNWIIEIIFQNLIEIHTQKRFLECCNSIDILKIFFKIFLKKIFQ